MQPHYCYLIQICRNNIYEDNLITSLQSTDLIIDINWSFFLHVTETFTSCLYSGFIIQWFRVNWNKIHQQEITLQIANYHTLNKCNPQSNKF